MYPRGAQLASTLKGLFGTDTGYVLAWQPDSGFRKVPGSGAPMPNGLEKSRDGRFVYVNAYLADEVRKVDRASGEVVAHAAVAAPDNVTWSRDGRLLVASHTASLAAVTACQDIDRGACGFAFRVVALDPDDLSAEVLLEHRGPPMGGVTVALHHEDELLLGTFAGDRIGRYRLP